MGMGGKGENRGNTGEILEMSTGDRMENTRMVREELQRKKLRGRKGNELARICWEEVRVRARRGRKLSG